MSVRTKRLWGPSVITIGIYGLLFTCPADRTARILQLAITNNGVAANSVLLRQGALPFLPWYQSPVVGAGLTSLVDVVLVLTEGETVQGIAGGPGMTIWAGGSLLLGDPA